MFRRNAHTRGRGRTPVWTLLYRHERDQLRARPVRRPRYGPSGPRKTLIFRGDQPPLVLASPVNLEDVFAGLRCAAHHSESPSPDPIQQSMKETSSVG